ncbi:MAG: hypothetical protein JWQ07_5776 [Ramlibacter sp.]|nr:hypothetical protein [Ramlibacter sp.]
MLIDGASLCTVCQYLQASSGSRMQCDASPHGIHRVIWVGRIDHRRPYAGDDGLRFEMAADAPPEVVARLIGTPPAAEWIRVERKIRERGYHFFPVKFS